ncbi:MAG: hypothetical protein ACRDSF_14205 [Pseudonocardiaceae bacterium]
MPDYEVLASSCYPDDSCPKVAQRVPGMLAIVGDPITDPAELVALGVSPSEAAVQITEVLYRAGHVGLEGRTA